jgi:hypothetical protein
MKIFKCAETNLPDEFPISGRDLHMESEGVYESAVGSRVIVFRAGHYGKSALVFVSAFNIAEAADGVLSERFRQLPNAKVYLDIKA